MWTFFGQVEKTSGWAKQCLKQKTPVWRQFDIFQYSENVVTALLSITASVAVISAQISVCHLATPSYCCSSKTLDILKLYFGFCYYIAKHIAQTAH